MQYFEMDCPCKGKNLDKLLQPSVLEILYRGPLHGFAVVTALGARGFCRIPRESTGISGKWRREIFFRPSGKRRPTAKGR